MICIYSDSKACVNNRMCYKIVSQIGSLDPDSFQGKVNEVIIRKQGNYVLNGGVAACAESENKHACMFQALRCVNVRQG
ncbi:MAG: hypothetical protein FWD15_04675 [Alphaproteobacteria bacterium]|nr:hypothetical protein [Alphaproteobacteria bacterium]